MSLRSLLYRWGKFARIIRPDAQQGKKQITSNAPCEFTGVNEVLQSSLDAGQDLQAETTNETAF
jgi:hypothetical protein